MAIKASAACGARVLLLAATAGVWGCAEPQEADFSYAKFPGAGREAVFAAAQATMQEFYQVDESDPRAGVIRSAPAEVEPEPRPALGRTLSSRPQRRSIAEFRVHPAAEAVIVGCRVTLQDNEARTQQAFLDQQGVEEIPNRTPLEEARGADVEGSAFWVTTGTDPKLERQLLAAVAERVARGSNNPPGTDDDNSE